MLGRPEYRSEITRFLDNLKKQDKYLEKKQQTARMTWWESKLTPDFIRRAFAVKVKQKPYVYQTKPNQD
jgi:hypothetical protein